MFSSIISLRMANWNKWIKLFTDLLALFINFIGLIYWIWICLLVLVLAYTVSILIAVSFRFSQSPEWNTFIFLSLFISRAHEKNLPLSIASSLMLN